MLNADTITNCRLKKLAERDAEFDLDGIRATPTVTTIPPELARFVLDNLFNRAAREIANRDENDLKPENSRLDIFRVATPPDKQTQFFNFKENPDQKGEFICDAPTETFTHRVTLRYLGEVDGEYRFHYISDRQHKTDTGNRLIMEGAAVIALGNPARPGIEVLHRGFSSDLPKGADGSYLDLVPNYREVALLNPTPKAELRAMLG